MVKLEGSENHHSWSYCIKSWKVAMRLENINEGNYMEVGKRKLSGLRQQISLFWSKLPDISDGERT
jgi:hypothetical protein